MTTLRLKRGTTTQNNSYTGPSGELTMDTTANQLRLHNGTTLGGITVGIMIATPIKTSAYNANVNELIKIDSTTGSFTITLPATPNDGARISFIDVANQCGTNPVLVAANGKTILGDSTGISLDANGAGLELIFNNLTNNWSNINIFSSSMSVVVDLTPNAFNFTDQTNVALSSTITSNTVTITGLSPNVSITVSGSGGTIDAGTSVLSGTFAASKSITTSGTGTIVVAGRMTSSGSYNQQTSMTITAGTVSDTWYATTAAMDLTPDAFNFTDQTNVSLSSTITSNTVTITGLSPNVSITVSGSGGTIDAGTSVLSGTFAASKSITTSGTGTIVVAGRMTSSGSYNQQTSMTITAGTVSDTWYVTTAAMDLTPDAFNFTDQTGVALSSTITSNTVTITGLSPNVSITVSGTGGTVDAGTSVLSGTFAASKTITTSGTGTIVVAGRMTASGSYNQQTSMTITAGTVSDTWYVTTAAMDLTPDAFNFTDQTNVALSSTITSNTVTITGLSPNVSITVSGTGGTVDAGTSVLSGTFAASKTVTTSGTGTIVVAGRMTASGSYNQQTSMTITAGTVSDTWNVTTTAVLNFTGFTSPALINNYTSAALMSAIEYGNNTFVSIGYNGSSYAVYSTSTNGTTWSSPTLMNNSNSVERMRSIIFANGTFFAKGFSDYGDSIAIFKTSNDGITWSEKTGIPDLAAYAYGNGTYVGVGNYALPTFSYSIGNLDSWTAQEYMGGLNDTSTFMKSVTYGNGKFVSVGNRVSKSPVYSTSTNGTTWLIPTNMSDTTEGALLTSITYGNGKFVAIGNTFSSQYPVYTTSTDGVAWTSISIIGTNIGSVILTSITCNANGKFVAIGYNPANKYPVYTSSDNGTTWTTLTYISNSDAQLKSIAVNSTGTFVAVGYNTATQPWYTVSTST